MFDDIGDAVLLIVVCVCVRKSFFIFVWFLLLCGNDYCE